MMVVVVICSFARLHYFWQKSRVLFLPFANEKSRPFHVCLSHPFDFDYTTGL